MEITNARNRSWSSDGAVVSSNSQHVYTVNNMQYITDYMNCIMQLHAQWNNILAADALHMQVPMTTLDLMDLSTSLPSPICEGTTVFALCPPAAVAHQGSHSVGQEQISVLEDSTSVLGDGASVLGDGASVLEDSTSVGRTVPLVLPTVEVPQRRERTVMSMSLRRTLASKNQPMRGDSPSRRKARGQSTIPREPLSDMQQLGSECSKRHMEQLAVANVLLSVE